jgi:WD repeat-containing protein 11
MIGLVYDACRYLQDNGKWEKAAWLAKMRLNDEEYFEIIKRWCDYLCVIDRKV